MDYGDVKAGRLASESQEGGKDLEDGRIKGAKEATETEKIVAK